MIVRRIAGTLFLLTVSLLEISLRGSLGKQNFRTMTAALLLSSSAVESKIDFEKCILEI